MTPPPTTQTPSHPLPHPPSALSLFLRPPQYLPSFFHLLTAAAALCLLHAAALALYRLYLSPLRRFPGSRVAAATGWLEFWDDVVCQGRGVWRVQEWHRLYGPIIRISPHELHVSDPSFHSTLYVSSAARRTDKWAWHAKLFGSTSTTVGAVEHDVHRARRAPLARFFASRNFAAGGELEGVVLRGVGRLGQRLRQSEGEVVNLSAALAACSADVVGTCALGEGFGLLERDDLGETWWRLMLDLSRNTHVMKQFGWIYVLFTRLPQRLVALVHPLTKQLFDVQNSIAARIDEARDALSSHKPSTSVNEKETKGGEEAAERLGLENTTRTTLLAHMLSTSSSSSSSSSSSPRALADELFTLLGAGTLSTSHALSVLLYHVHAHPPLLRRLRAELAPLYRRSSNSTSTSTSNPPPPSLAALQSLPFLSCCITEALRLSHGVAGRLPRVAPADDLVYTAAAETDRAGHVPVPAPADERTRTRPRTRRWVIPSGTPVSMTHMFVHLDASIYPDPQRFAPERWWWLQQKTAADAAADAGADADADARAARERMLHHLTPFGRGSRACVGRDLAMAVMAAAVGEVVGGLYEREGFEMELFETGRDEVEVGRDWFGGVPEKGMRSKGVRVRVVRRR